MGAELFLVYRNKVRADEIKPWCIVAVDGLVAEGFYKVGDPKFAVL
jgi:hypothetical protein